MPSPLLEALAEGRAPTGPDVDALNDHDFEAALRDLLRLEQAVAATKLRFLDSARRRASHVRHGAGDTAAWIADLSGERRGVVRREVALAEQVAEAPVVSAALDGGDVSKAQAAELVAAAPLPVPVQERLVGRAATMPVERLGDAVRQALLDHRVVPADPVPHAEVEQTASGGRVEAVLDVTGFEIVQTAVRAAVDRLGLPTDRPMAERGAAGLVALARHFLEHVDAPKTSRTGLAHILAVVPLDVLEARSGGSARLASGAVISGDTARRMACDAGVSRVITDGESAPLDVGRSTPTIPAATAKAVIVRDRHCRAPGCDAPPWACEIHHVVHWAHGGATDLGNLRLLCHHHHHLEHETSEPWRTGAA